MALAATFLIATALPDSAFATRGVEVTFRNNTSQNAVVNWWGNSCIEGCESPYWLAVPAKGGATIQSSVDVLSRWDVIGRVGVIYDRNWHNPDGRLMGPCFAGRNPTFGQPRFAMSEEITRQSPGFNSWKVCEAGSGTGAFDQTFEQDVTTVFFRGSPEYGTMLVSRNQDNDASIRFTVAILSLPQPPQQMLRVSVNDPNGGTVKSVTPGIACGTKCASSFTRGIVVQLLAKPMPGYYLASWGGDCNHRDDACQVWTTQDMQVVATFLPIPPDRLSIGFSGNGGGRVKGDSSGVNCVVSSTACETGHPRGSSVLLRAYPDGESLFGGWTGACTGTADTCLVSMLEAKSVQATFTLRPTVTLTVDMRGIGEVTGGGIRCRVPEAPQSPNTCVRTFARGATITLTAISIGDAAFQAWGGTGGCNVTNPCTITLDHDYQPSAQFATPPAPQTIRVIKSGTGTGLVTGPRIDCGETCTASYVGSALLGLTFTATPNPGSTFDHWEGACGRSGTVATCRTLLIGTVTAVFVARPAPAQAKLAVTTAGDGGGEITSTPAGIACQATCVADFATGTTITLEAIPDRRSEFTGWSGSCTGRQRTCNVRLDASRLVTAVFSRTPFIDPIVPPDAPVPPVPVVEAVESVTSDQPYTELLAAAPPMLTELRVSRRVLHHGGSAIIRYSLDRNAEVKMVFKRAGSRRVRYVYRIRRGKSGGDAGANAVRILTRINNRNVRAGRWTMTISATTPDGTSATLRRVLMLR